jgi:hypothetical protein
MKLRRLFFLLAAFLCLSLGVSAQWGDEQMAEKPSLKDRMFFGGGFGMNFSSNYDFFSISPIIGYKLSPRVASGISVIYRYTKHKYVNPSVSTNDYGVSPFLRYQFYGRWRVFPTSRETCRVLCIYTLQLLIPKS